MAQTRKSTKPRNFWGALMRLASYLSARIWWIILVLILAIISAIAFAQLPRVMGDITNIIFDGVSQGWQEGGFPVDFEAVRAVVIRLAMIYVVASFGRYFQQFITTRVAQHTVYDLRNDMKQKMGRLPIKYFDTNSTGDILSRAINDMDQVSSSLGQTITQITTSSVQIVAVLFTMLDMSGPLAIIVILMAPTMLLLISFIAPKAQRQFALRQSKLGIVNDFIEEVYSAHEVVKVYNQEESESKLFNDKSDELNEASWQAEFYSGLMNPMIGSVKDTAYIAVAFFGGIMIINGSTQIGTVQAFLQYVNQFANPFRALAQLTNSIQMTVAAVERVFEVLDEEEMDFPEGLETVEDHPYKVAFEGVQFGYSPNELIMSDFNLDVNSGEMIAIVGPTGAGKTTLINLLERFYDVSGGAIRIDGVDIRNIDRDELRDRFSMVLQDTWLFSGTIWDNLRYGSEDATDEEILQASKAAHVHDFVMTMADGYQTILSEDGSNLSQGQRQLITIARAFLKDPELIILDEATSSVDTRTEVMIQKAMNRLLEGRTSFVVAHRLSTIRDADKIVVMNKGDVVESGNHDELIAADGFYADLYRAQFA